MTIEKEPDLDLLELKSHNKERPKEESKPKFVNKGTNDLETN
jgi:hypothetical protein